MDFTVEASTVEQARGLLLQAGLSATDLADDPGLRLFGIQRAGRLIGVVGLQPLDGAALLRSLAVAPAERNRGAGHFLVAAAEAEAARWAAGDIYLLTTDAAAFFDRLGYQALARDEAPPSLRATRQFSELCPASAQVMCKRLARSG